jgi:predicted DNA-binding transcriptional regulator YafY
MAINKLALIRYKTIDNCLQNRFRKWTLDDLIEACSDALFEYEGITNGISRRAIQLDLQNMRSEKLGYNAPIVVSDKKYYSYGESSYSITNIPLTQQDLGTLHEVVGVLKQFKGFGYFQELNGMITKLEDKLYKQGHKGKSFIDFEKNELLKGLEFIDPLHKAMVNRKAIQISYQSFKARQSMDFVFYPYLLKEYRNRWFVVGKRKDRNELVTLALDRMLNFSELEREKFVKSDFDVNAFFDDAIGVSKTSNMKSEVVTMKIERAHFPYILTKPIHPSQKILKEEKDGVVFSIEVVLNFELEREILGFGQFIQVLGPRRLKSAIKKRLESASQRYQKREDLN